jgi:hypothetical protein
MKIYPVEAELFHPNGRIDMHDEANGLFSQVCKSAWKQCICNCKLSPETTELEAVTFRRIFVAN